MNAQAPSATAPNLTWSEYRTRAEASAACLARHRDAAQRLGLDSLLAPLDAEIEQLRNNRFTIAVIGDFKTGKSTLINGLLGRDVLPTDLRPCSASLCRITYSEKPYARVYFRDGRIQEVRVDELVDFSTKLTEKSEETARSVREVEVGYPLELCRNGVVLLDTPGLDDEAGMTEVTLAVLPTVDAALFVMIPEKPVSEREQEFVGQKLLINHVHRVLFIVNAIDRVENSKDRQRLLDTLERRLRKPLVERLEALSAEPDAAIARQFTALSSNGALAISSRLALWAKQQIHGAPPMDPGFAQMEQQLERLVLTERGALLLGRAEGLRMHAAGEIEAAIASSLSALEATRERLIPQVESSLLIAQEIKVAAEQQANRLSEKAAALEREYLAATRATYEEVEAAATGAIDGLVVTPTDFVSQKHALVTRIVSALQQSTSETLQAQMKTLSDRLEAAYLDAVHHAEAHFADAEARIRGTPFFQAGFAKGANLASRETLRPSTAALTFTVRFDDVDAAVERLGKAALTNLDTEQASATYAVASWASNLFFKAPSDMLAMNIYRFREFLKKNVRPTICQCLQECEANHLGKLAEHYRARFVELIERFDAWRNAVARSLLGYTVSRVFDEADRAAGERADLERLRSGSAEDQGRPGKAEMERVSFRVGILQRGIRPSIQ